MALSSLILIGGQSSRMGIPKHTLLLQREMRNSDPLPLLVHLLLAHHDFHLTMNGTKSQIWISARDENQKAAVIDLLSAYELPREMDVQYLLDEPLVFGPAAGFLSAFAQCSSSNWLITACDHPLLSSMMLKELYTSHISTNAVVTCFENDQGFSEPLLGIWTPLGLEFLIQETAQSEGHSPGPSQVLRKLQRLPLINDENISRCGSNVNLVIPTDSACLLNVNTPEDWTKFKGAT